MCIFGGVRRIHRGWGGAPAIKRRARHSRAPHLVIPARPISSFPRKRESRGAAETVRVHQTECAN